MQTNVPTGNVANDPNSLDSGTPRESPQRGFQTYPSAENGMKQRIRPESFSDHFTQPRMFWLSMTDFEQRHIVSAIAFELGKCTEMKIRRRMLGRLENVHPDLAERVANSLGMAGQAEKLAPAVPVGSPEPSVPLSQYSVAPKSLRGKKIGLLTTDGVDAEFFKAVRQAAKDEGATVALITPKAGPIKDSDGNELVPDDFLAGAPSALFDCVLIAPAEGQAESLATEAAAVDWVRDAYAHLKVVGYTDEAVSLIELTCLLADDDEGMLKLTSDDLSTFISRAKQHRIWDREPHVRS
jgi:catalase